jgi:triosephosphate isomerase
MNKLLIFNWKMNPNTLKEALDLARASDYKNTVIAPPFVFLEEIGKIIKNAELGAQDVFWENPPAGSGAFTGEISAKELKNLDVKYAIIGHSERRYKLGETDEMIAKKIETALKEGLIPVLCVGETRKERDAGKKEEVIKRQLEIDLFLTRQAGKTQKILIAYEPVWAIGTGEPETPKSALETIKFIKKILVASRYPLIAKILYGGSVDSKNLGNYLKFKGIDGALVGGASLKQEEVRKMHEIK